MFLYAVHVILQGRIYCQNESEIFVDLTWHPILRSFFMAAAYLPSILVPLVGLVFPAIAMASLFLYIEKEEIA
jgi:photosystem I subunit 8